MSDEERNYAQRLTDAEKLIEELRIREARMAFDIGFWHAALLFISREISPDVSLQRLEQLLSDAREAWGMNEA